MQAWSSNQFFFCCLVHKFPIFAFSQNRLQIYCLHAFYSSWVGSKKLKNLHLLIFSRSVCYWKCKKKKERQNSFNILFKFWERVVEDLSSYLMVHAFKAMAVDQYIYFFNIKCLIVLIGSIFFIFRTWAVDNALESRGMCWWMCSTRNNEQWAW